MEDIVDIVAMSMFTGYGIYFQCMLGNLAQQFVRGAWISLFNIRILSVSAKTCGCPQKSICESISIHLNANRGQLPANQIGIKWAQLMMNQQIVDHVIGDQKCMEK